MYHVGPCYSEIYRQEILDGDVIKLDPQVEIAKNLDGYTGVDYADAVYLTVIPRSWDRDFWKTQAVKRNLRINMKMERSLRYEAEAPPLVAPPKPADYTMLIIIGGAVVGILVLYCLYRCVRACVSSLASYVKSMQMAPATKTKDVADAGFHIPDFPKGGRVARQEDQPQNQMQEENYSKRDKSESGSS